MIEIKKFMDEIASTQNCLKDYVDSHLGWLMSLALKVWRAEERVHVIKFHYTVDGVTAKIWMPFDKKYYRINISEEKS